MKVPFEGGCACKLIRYKVAVEPLVMAHCHCRDCQYSSGTGHSSVLVVPISEVNIAGKPKYYESKASDGNVVRRGFCPECGTPMFSVSEAYKDVMGIKAATLDYPSEFQPVADAWMSRTLLWDVTDPATYKFEKDIEAR